MGTPSNGDDELPLLLRRSHISSPPYDHDLRFESRNSEGVHGDALATALAEHERIRLIALRALELNEAREENEKLRQHALQEEERVRIETERAKEECRLRDVENKARSIPKPAPRIATPPPAETPKPQPTPIQQPIKQPPPPTQPQPQMQTQAQISKPQPLTTTPQQPPPPNPFQKPTLQLPTQPAAPPTRQSTVQQPPKPAAPAVPPPQPSPAQRPSQQDLDSHILPEVGRYLEIHKNLKQLRAMIRAAGTRDAVFKRKAGDMRRDMRKFVSQLTIGSGVNKFQQEHIMGLFNESLKTVRSDPIDPSLFMLSKPEQKDGATHNGETLPSLFIFLMNSFAKSVVSSLCQEAPADPIGVLVAQVFSTPEFKWRDESLIDIQIAKFVHSCPILFGARGSEKTEQGRTRLGWRKDGDDWISEQDHVMRMGGLGAGYAAISLRNFGRTTKINPYPPYHYWQAMASILSTPPELASPSTYIVLKAMIGNFEGRFMSFYGDAARAALRIALIEFPARALDQTNPSVLALKILADSLEKEQGLVLR